MFVSNANVSCFVLLYLMVFIFSFFLKKRDAQGVFQKRILHTLKCGGSRRDVLYSKTYFRLIRIKKKHVVKPTLIALTPLQFIANKHIHFHFIALPLHRSPLRQVLVLFQIIKIGRLHLHYSSR